MAQIEYDEIKFFDKIDHVQAVFLKHYYFDIPKQEILKIGPFQIIDKKIVFEDHVSEKKINNKINFIIDNGFSHLYSITNKRRTIYIHKNSQIPLIGSQYFGIIDRNSNLIELRPNTGCVLNCIYCSVDEGSIGKKTTDYIVEQEYLANELKKLIDIKETDNIEININPQGEPLLYEPIFDLIKSISKIEQVKRISIDTSGILLNKQIIDKLRTAGLTNMNVSLNAIDPEIASKLAGSNYNVHHVLDNIIYAKNKIKVLIAPILISGINDDEIEKIIVFCKEHSLDIGIQNFLKYKQGRNPAKQLSFNKFFKLLDSWENKYKIKLKLDASDCHVFNIKKLPCPIKKDEKIRAEIICPGRYLNECIAIYKERSIQVKNCPKKQGLINIQITKTKHNIIQGVYKDK